MGAIVAPVTAPVASVVEVRSSAPEDLPKPPPGPAKLSIPSLDISMTIRGVGNAPDGTMELVSSSLVAGWYRFGGHPGASDGNVVLAAHVDDAKVGLGPFAKLRDITPGATVVVTSGDGSPVSYQVTAIEQTNKDRVELADVFAGSPSEMLVLITCGGRFDRDARHYEDNVIVWALPDGAS